MKSRRHQPKAILTTYHKIILIFIGILLFSYYPAQAQSPSTSIVGAVVDPRTGLPIANASISVGAASTQTDASGNFSLVIPVAEPYQLVTIAVTVPGYGSWTMNEAILYPNITRTFRIELGPQDQVYTQGLPRALTGELQLAPAVAPLPYAPGYYSNSIIPPTIRVAITGYVGCGAWVAAGQPVVRVDTIDFRTYVKNVLPNEWGPAYPTESLRAGAMAVKMFAWWRINLGGVRAGGSADVVDNTCDQYYVPNSATSTTDAAVGWTWLALMRRNGIVIEIHYLGSVSQCQSSPYPPCMPIQGTSSDALAGMDWQSILHKYYDPVQISLPVMFLPLLVR